MVLITFTDTLSAISPKDTTSRSRKRVSTSFLMKRRTSTEASNTKSLCAMPMPSRPSANKSISSSEAAGSRLRKAPAEVWRMPLRTMSSTSADIITARNSPPLANLWQM